MYRLAFIAAICYVICSSTVHGLSVSLVSATTSTDAPFSFGQAFTKGYIPQDTYIVANISTFQATVKNRWPDGSVKFAILSGRADVPTVLDIGATATAPTATVLTEQDLANSGLTASVSFSPFGTVQLAPLINVASQFDSNANRFSAGRVTQWISGSEMSSWIYYSPIGSDPHLAAWFEVQFYLNGAVDVFAWVENGYMNVPNPTDKNGTITLTVGGTERFSLTDVNMPYHTRIVLATNESFSHWLAPSTPTVIALHNTTYLQDTRLVPNYYGNTSPSSSAFSQITTTYVPQSQGDYSPAMGRTGYHPSIGLVPFWDALYLTSGADPRAHRAVIINGMLAGRFGIHYRDEKTNMPLRFADYPNTVIGGAGLTSTGGSSKNMYTPTTSGASPPVWAASHHPSIGYMAYLITGRFYFMEQLQFVSCIHFLKESDTRRNFTTGLIWTNSGAFTTRGAGWAIRSMIQSATATPDDYPLKQQFVDAFRGNLHYYYSKYIVQQNNPQGFCAPYVDYTSSPPYMHAGWMEDFFTAAWGYSIDLALPISTSEQQMLGDFFYWKSRSVVGRLGGTSSTEYYFADAASYNIAVSPSDSPDFETGTGPWYNDWGELYNGTIGAPSPNTPVDGNLRGGNFPDPTSYWGNMLPALAYAVQHDAPGAKDAYERLTSAANWNKLSFNDEVVWGVKPRPAMSVPSAPLTPRPDSPNQKPPTSPSSGPAVTSSSNSNVAGCVVLIVACLLL